MSKESDKLKKKQIKAEVKKYKAEAGLKEKEIKRKLSTVSADLEYPGGISVVINKRGSKQDLVIRGLDENQIKRLIPEINKEILITVAEEKNFFRALLLKFMREGLFQTIVKVIAGLIVGILLLKLGFK